MAKYKADIKPHFSKKFEFRSLGDKPLKCSQPFENLPWEIEELQQLKNSLNSTKNLLNDKDIRSWHMHTSKTNHAGFIFHRVRTEISPELLTQAWLKFYECISQFNLIHNSIDINQFSSLHLCEAPGAFVTSLNHYLSSECDNVTKFQWIATTLNPYYEGNSSSCMVDDDRFMLHSLNKWDFGVDNTGDIMNWANAQHIIEKTANQNIMMVTADGSINCVDDPGSQENRVTRLHWCELITALSVLNEGGTFVLKVFTFFEHMTVSLLYVLKMFFQTLHTFKPCTSKEGNSEVYLIAINYQKSEENSHFLKILQHWVYEKNVDFTKSTLFSKCELPEDFLTDVVNSARFFKTWQENAILRNLVLYNLPENDRSLVRLKNNIADHYVKICRLKTIPEALQLVGIKNLAVAHWKLESRFQLNKTLLPRLLTNFQSQRIELKTELNDINFRVSDNMKIDWVPDSQHWRDHIDLVHGKPCDRIENSKFCYSRAINIFSFIQNHENEKENNKAVIPRAVLDSFWSSALTEGQDFLLENVSILSRFAVSSVWIVGHLFSKVELSLDEGPSIRFVNYQGNTEIIEWLKELDYNLLAFINIPVMCCNPFYEMVFRYNTKMLMQQASILLGND